MVRIDPLQLADPEQARALTLARYYAKRHVKEDLLRRRIKLSHVEPMSLGEPLRPTWLSTRS